MPEEGKRQTGLSKKLNRGILYCYVVGALCAIRAGISYNDLFGAGAWLAGAFYFFTAPSSLRRGVENRRILVGMLSVLLVMLSFTGAMGVFAGAFNLYTVTSLATVIVAAFLVPIFGYNQEIACHIRSLGSNGGEQSKPSKN